MPTNFSLTNLGGRDFMRRHPLISMQSAGGGGARVIKGDPNASVGRVDSGARVLYANVATAVAYVGLPLRNAIANRESASLTLGMNAPGVPLFHLPYNNDQNYRVTLVDRQGIGNVNFFITEFVDGCSVYVEGTRTAPTAYHINARNTQRTQNWKQFYWSDVRKRNADWAAKFDKMDNRFKHDGTAVKTIRNAVPGLTPPTKLENHDYMGDLGLDLNALQHANKAPTLLAGQTVDGFELIAQQGTVFGERNAGSGEWKFYIQRRALLQYLHINPVGAPASLGYDWLVDSVEQFWPTAKTGRVVP